ncbi:MAG: hypothetical protein JST81_08765 [Bacteroidetes bacterium]|nr:hypothetical protein [Bacteroidota bacterium]
MLDKILILDDKAYSEDFSTSKVLSNLTVVGLSLVEYYENTESLWLASDNDDDINLMRDFSNYSFIFIHDSFENPLVRDGLKAVLFEKLSRTSKIVLFSGSRAESEIPIERIYDEKISKDTFCYEILRRQYFNNLQNFIDSYLVSGKYQIKYLYNPYINPKKDKAYTLLENIKTDLEESIECAIESNSFNELLSMYGYENNSEISNRFLNMTDDSFVENLEDFIENN